MHLELPSTHPPKKKKERKKERKQQVFYFSLLSTVIVLVAPSQTVSCRDLMAPGKSPWVQVVEYMV